MNSSSVAHFSELELEATYANMEEPCETSQYSYEVEQVLRLYVHSIICILGLFGNVLVIVTYAFYKKAKSMTDVYLLNVAIADVMFVVALPLIIYNEQSGWAMGNWACKLLRGVYSMNVYSGILLLACISGDRYLAIVQARRSFRIRSSTLLYSHLICATVWLLALALSMPTFIYYERYMPGAHDGNDYYGNFSQFDLMEDGSIEYFYDDGSNSSLPASSAEQRESQHVCFYSFQNNKTAHLMKILVPSMQVVMGFFLPLLVMSFCYTSVLVTLLRARNFQRHKAVRVVLAVVVVFLACHMPYNMTLLYDTVGLFHQQDCDEIDNIEMALKFTETLAYLHCCLNPLLYAFVGVKFRNHFRKILQDVWCLGKSYMSARRSSRATSEMYFSTRRSVDGSTNDGTSFTM